MEEIWKALVLVLNLYGIANIIYDSQQAGGVVLKLMAMNMFIHCQINKFKKWIQIQLNICLCPVGTCFYKTMNLYNFVCKSEKILKVVQLSHSESDIKTQLLEVWERILINSLFLHSCRINTIPNFLLDQLQRIAGSWIFNTSISTFM